MITIEQWKDFQSYLRERNADVAKALKKIPIPETTVKKRKLLGWEWEATYHPDHYEWMFYYIHRSTSEQMLRADIPDNTIEGCLTWLAEGGLENFKDSQSPNPERSDTNQCIPEDQSSQPELGPDNS